MTKRFILSLTIALVAVSANAQFLFRISGKKIKAPSYILGSVHTLVGPSGVLQLLRNEGYKVEQIKVKR
ncbi:hypothetical protein [Prevotella sp. P6B1]|uniref:hypothetical protein n=1 Tax=Prevotella sp. P6B1 TaxID=1410613 RepID=UPI00051BD1EA|nr:hypothetical protein [Prevotella sp. P6B1]